jgi:ribonucleoside-triphosphate reductase
LDKRKLRKRGGGLFGANPLTGSIGVVTINLPRIGYLSENELEFFKQLEKLVFLATQSLSIKRKILERFTDKNLYPYSTFYLT